MGMRERGREREGTGVEDPEGAVGEDVELGFDPSHEIHGFL